MKRILIALAGLAAAIAAPTIAIAQEEEAPQAPRIYAPVNYNATEELESILHLDLSNGERVSIRLMADWAPNHVLRIKTLTRQGFYDGLVFHRVIEGFMAQTGDPLGTGGGGSELPDLKQEFNRMPHLRGTLSMARRADSEDSANSQFFIVFYPTMKLDQDYTNFGRVIRNMAAVDKIARGEPPANPTRILQASIGADNKPQRTAPKLAPAPTEITADMLSNSESQ